MGLTMQTKPGKHGTLKLFRIAYRDGAGCPTFTQTCWAYDREHAEERFLDAPDADGWEIISITYA
jgi:hypothetical protein